MEFVFSSKYCTNSVSMPTCVGMLLLILLLDRCRPDSKPVSRPNSVGNAPARLFVPRLSFVTSSPLHVTPNHSCVHGSPLIHPELVVQLLPAVLLYSATSADTDALSIAVRLFAGDGGDTMTMPCDCPTPPCCSSGAGGAPSLLLVVDARGIRNISIKTSRPHGVALGSKLESGPTARPRCFTPGSMSVRSELELSHRACRTELSVKINDLERMHTSATLARRNIQTACYPLTKDSSPGCPSLT